MTELLARHRVSRPSSAPRSSGRAYAGSPLEFIRSASQHPSGQSNSNRARGAKQRHPGNPALKQSRIDPCVLAALASRPHTSAASRPRSTSAAERTADWVNYVLPNGQRPSDFADVSRIEYTGDDLATMWRLSFATDIPTQIDGDALFFVSLKGSLVSALSVCFYRGSDESSPAIVVSNISRTTSCNPDAESASEFVASISITFPEAAKLTLTAEESVLGTVSSHTFANDFTEHLTIALRGSVIDNADQPDISIAFGSMVLEHPSEIELRGGHGEPIVVASLPEHGRAVREGISEGFELLWYESFDKLNKCWCKCTDFNNVVPSEIFAKGRVELPIKIAFRSPLSRLPNLSERELAEQLGLRRVREFHFRRLVIELKHTWKKLEVQSKRDFLNLYTACGEDLVLIKDVDIGTSQLIRRLPEGTVLRSIDDGKPLRWKDLPNLRVPAILRVGRPIEEAQPQVTAQQFRKALRRAGIMWLSPEQENDLLCHLTPSQEEIDRYEDTAWEMSLAERFVMDTEGLFVHIGRVVKANQILAVTRALQRRLAARSNQDGFNGTLSFSEFLSAMTTGGITWLRREQVAAIFNSMTSGDSGISFGDWLSRFQWEPIKAVTEVQRALEPNLAKGRVSGRRQSRMAKPRLDLNFPDFQSRLFDLGVSWLTVEQQRIIFDTIDVDRSGSITEEELAKVAEVRKELEREREETLAKEMEERAAIESERAAQIAARVQAAEAERQAEVEVAKAAFDEKMRPGKQLAKSSSRNSLISKEDFIEALSESPKEETSRNQLERREGVVTQPAPAAQEAKTSTEEGKTADSNVDISKRSFREKLQQSAEDGTLPRALEQALEMSADNLDVAETRLPESNQHELVHNEVAANVQIDLAPNAEHEQEAEKKSTQEDDLDMHNEVAANVQIELTPNAEHEQEAEKKSTQEDDLDMHNEVAANVQIELTPNAEHEQEAEKKSTQEDDLDIVRSVALDQ